MTDKVDYPDWVTGRKVKTINPITFTKTYDIPEGAILTIGIRGLMNTYDGGIYVDIKEYGASWNICNFTLVDNRVHLLDYVAQE